MNLTLGQEIMCGVALVVALLLAASVRMSCTDVRVGSIHVGPKRVRGTEPGKVPARAKKNATPRR